MELDLALFQCTCISRSSKVLKNGYFLIKNKRLFGSNFGSVIIN